MNKHKSLKSAQSLLERASDLYGFDTAMRGKAEPVMKKTVVQPIKPADPVKDPSPIEREAVFKEETAHSNIDETVSKPIIKTGIKTGEDINIEAKKLSPQPKTVDSVADSATKKPEKTPSVAKRDEENSPKKIVYNNEGVREVDREWLAENNMIVPDGPVTALSEEFRIVKRQLLLAARGGKGVTAVAHGERILICSANPNEGKTYTSVNLALSMASEKDIRVLLIDADFAKPSVLSTLNIEGGPGLMDALADPSLDVNKMVLTTDVDGLSVLPAGSQSNQDTEYLAAARTAKIIEKLSQDDPNRIIIFDSPPALAASPASVLALHVGQTLMVVHADKTTDSALRDALNLLSGCDHVQLLLNRANFSPSGRNFGSYYGYGA